METMLPKTMQTTMQTTQTTLLGALRSWLTGLARVGASIRAPY